MTNNLTAPFILYNVLFQCTCCLQDIQCILFYLLLYTFLYSVKISSEFMYMRVNNIPNQNKAFSSYFLVL